MKTTLDIPEPLLEKARQFAKREHVTLKALVETALRRLIDDPESKPDFKLRDQSFGGDGLQPDVRNAEWDKIRDRAYENHGA